MQIIKKFFNNAAKDIIDSFRILKKRVHELLIPMAFDYFFVFIYYAFFSFITLKVANALGMLGVIASGADIEKQTTLSEVFLQPKTMPYVWNLLFWLILMILAFYILYMMFQGMSWFYCRKIALQQERPGLLAFIKEFSILNIPWYIFFIVFSIISFLNEVVVKEDNIGYLVTFMFLVLFFFVFISYSLIGRFRIPENIRKSLETGTNKFIYILPVYIIIFAVFFILLTLKMHLANRIIETLFEVLVILPSISWARVYVILVVNRLDS